MATSCAPFLAATAINVGAQETNPIATSGSAHGRFYRPTACGCEGRAARPITAGGFVDGAPIISQDATLSSGLDKFLHHSGTPEKTTILESVGSGLALLDYDNDGWLDIYILNGSKCRLNGKGRSLARCSFITITTVRLRTSPKKPVSPTSAGDSDGGRRLR